MPALSQHNAKLQRCGISVGSLTCTVGMQERFKRCLMRCDDAARVGVCLCGKGQTASMIVSSALVTNLPTADVLGAKLWCLPSWIVLNALLHNSIRSDNAPLVTLTRLCSRMRASPALSEQGNDAPDVVYDARHGHEVAGVWHCRHYTTDSALKGLRMCCRLTKLVLGMCFCRRVCRQTPRRKT